MHGAEGVDYHEEGDDEYDEAEARILHELRVFHAIWRWRRRIGRACILAARAHKATLLIPCSVCHS
jgi:hypothetical protein